MYIRTETEDREEDTRVHDFEEIYLLKRGEPSSIKALEYGLQQAGCEYELHRTNKISGTKVLHWIRDGKCTVGEFAPWDIVWATYPASSQRWWPARVKFISFFLQLWCEVE